VAFAGRAQLLGVELNVLPNLCISFIMNAPFKASSLLGNMLPNVKVVLLYHTDLIDQQRSDIIDLSVLRRGSTLYLML